MAQERRRVGRFYRSLPFVASWLLVTAFAGTVRAAGGDLDDTFDGDGKVTTAFTNGAFATAAAIQLDGRIVAVGAAGGESASGVFAVARYDTDGALDATFGIDGQVMTAIGPSGGVASDVAIQPNGKIVAVGTANRERFAIVRYEADGSIDSTFGEGGIVTTNFTAGYDLAYGVTLQPNGKIIVVGSAGTYRPVFALARYRPDGTLDATFGGDGKVTTKYGVWGVAHDVVLQPNGRIVVVGGRGGGFALARYLPDGSLDPSFGSHGKASPDELFGDAFAVELQADGKIVAVGAFDVYRFAVARFTVRGRLDPAFSDDGWLSKDVGRGFEQAAIGVEIQATGKIVVAGHAGPHEYGDATPWRFVLLRYRPNGVLDVTFGGDGKVLTRFDGGASAHGAALYPDGRIVVVGGAGASNAEAFALARYLP